MEQCEYDHGTKDSADELSYDISADHTGCKASVTADCAGNKCADGNCRVEMRTGNCSEGISREQNCKAPSEDDLNGSAALHSGFVKVDITANTVSKDNKDHSAK